ncbi:MAG: DUF3313 family protein [Lysobacterales bacterium]|jgi:hypothetical protein
MNNAMGLALTLATLAAIPYAALADNDSTQMSPDGLQLVEKDRRGEIYADPNVDWSVYDRIKLDKATVAFRKNWQRDQNRSYPFKIQTQDMERIKSELSELFGEVFSKELSENGDYKITDETGDDVLRITPHIVDLDVYAPDARSSPVRTMSYTETAGRMTLQLELYDSVTGDLLARASDRKEAPRRGYLQWTNSVTNRMEARHMLEAWAKELKTRLDEASKKQPAVK